MENKFLCDAMLGHVGKWLRACGFDTEIANPKLSDKEILVKANLEKRIILTCDKKFGEGKRPETLLITLSTNKLEDILKELRNTGIIAELESFIRCLCCNDLLTRAPQEEIEKVPKKVLKFHQEFWFCPTCRKTYWEGSHVERMKKKIKEIVQYG